MKRTLTTFVTCVVLLFGSGSVGYAQDFQKGLDAFNKKDYATALREWTPLAKQGNANAQHNLGVMYRDGRGVPQDYKTALWRMPQSIPLLRRNSRQQEPSSCDSWRSHGTTRPGAAALNLCAATSFQQGWARRPVGSTGRPADTWRSRYSRQRTGCTCRNPRTTSSRLVPSASQV